MKKSIRIKCFGLRAVVQYVTSSYLVQVCDNPQGRPVGVMDDTYDCREFLGSRRQAFKSIRAWIVRRSAESGEDQIASVYELRGSEMKWIGDLHVRVCREFVVSFEKS